MTKRGRDSRSKSSRELRREARRNLRRMEEADGKNLSEDLGSPEGSEESEYEYLWVNDG
ncbi:MAG: hypothetical protein ACOC6Q_01580 [Patescibacteria group bacterium]